MKTLQKYTRQLIIVTVALLVILFFSLIPNVMDVIAELKGAIGLVAGALISVMGIFGADYLRNKERQGHNAALLLGDLQSVERYLSTPFEENSRNIRYSDNWQEMAAACTFLSGGEVQALYVFYDLVYGYHQCYGKEGTENSTLEGLYKDLSKEVLGGSYVGLVTTLNQAKNDGQV